MSQELYKTQGSGFCGGPQVVLLASEAEKQLGVCRRRRALAGSKALEKATMVLPVRCTAHVQEKRVSGDSLGLAETESLMNGCERL